MREEDELIDAIEVLLKFKAQLNESEKNPTIQKSKTDKMENITKDVELYKTFSYSGTSEEIRRKDELFYKITDYLDELDPE